ncbi:sperm-associated microtubule inner protein 10 [Eleutherodactylus coqui]|uniref:sperm-associated microtubule inner protein 10 n=1 Tax=Eleutherodactylus coqui TaxID=57060 RepID=UPI0034618D75
MSDSGSTCSTVRQQEHRNPNQNSLMNKRPKEENSSNLKEPIEVIQNPGTLVSVATITDIRGLVQSHISEFSRRHPIIPKRYVMPWKQDMVNRKLITGHADLAGLYRGPQEDSLFLQNKERLCHGEERHIITKKLKIPSLHQMTDFPLHSHLSRYQSYMINQKTRMLACYE